MLDQNGGRLTTRKTQRTTHVLVLLRFAASCSLLIFLIISEHLLIHKEFHVLQCCDTFAYVTGVTSQNSPQPKQPQEKTALAKLKGP